jgi:hypothetical protein
LREDRGRRKNADEMGGWEEGVTILVVEIAGILYSNVQSLNLNKG